MVVNQRTSRWGPKSYVEGLTGLPTAVSSPMTSEQVEAYAIQSDRHRRSPSPEPQYDSVGRRTNTRYRRYKQRLEEERHTLIRDISFSIPTYRTPLDYQSKGPKGSPYRAKIYLPTKEFPEKNFIGQLLGPRGQSLAELSIKSGASIAIRGKGSTNEGKGKAYRAGRHLDHEDEPLQCLITAVSQDNVDKTKSLVNEVVEGIIMLQEHENTRKRQQMRDLAVVDRTLRDDENMGGPSGRSSGVMEVHNRQRITCTVCGSAGHLGVDCCEGRRESSVATALPLWRTVKQAQISQEDFMNKEYRLLMKEVSL